MQNKIDTQRSQSTMSAVFRDMQESVFAEVGAIRSQTDQIKLLLEDAIASLHEAFGSIHSATDDQMKTMTDLMMQVVGAENEQNIFQQAESASEILTDLVDTLLHSSKNNLRALTAMDAMRTRLEQREELEQQENATIEKLLSCTKAESVDVDVVRELAMKLREQQKQQSAFTDKTMEIFKKTHYLIDNIASKDMEEVFTSKGKVEKIVQHFFEINTFVSNSRSTVAQVNADIRQHLGAAIRALQFEDISRQSLGYTDRHLDRMEGMLSILTDGLKGLDQSDISMEEYTARVAAIHIAMMEYHQALQLEDTNPVSQESMDEGDVDLF